MIPSSAITAWSSVTPWPNRIQIEQDLILSRLIIEISNHDYLGSELIFRGGTCLHKLHLDHARRYSEDLDYVRISATGIKKLTTTLTELGESLGFKVSTKIVRFPKIVFQTLGEDGRPLRIKIEVNTFERSPILPLTKILHSVESSWFSGKADVLTFAPVELMATKIRALYQRKKSRDLFDLWLALTELGLDPEEIITAFQPYRGGITRVKAEANLREKLLDPEFQNDLLLLINTWPAEYDLNQAAETIIDQIISKL